MARRATGTPENFNPKEGKSKVRQRFFEKNLPAVAEVFEAMKGQDIAPVIKQMVTIRIMRGITRKEMALACGIKLDALTMIELGHKLPSTALLIRMAFVLKGKIEFTGWMDIPPVVK